FQAEDGIRDRNVTGVQTCALPIWLADQPNDESKIALDRYCDRGPSHLRATLSVRAVRWIFGPADHGGRGFHPPTQTYRPHCCARSEERRVGKECRSRKVSYRSKEN